MFKNYEILYLGQGSPDRLQVLSISKELFDRHKNKDGQIVIGGGYNGLYYLIPAEIHNDEEYIGFDETINDTGIDNLVEMIDSIQNQMDWDNGSFISNRFLKALNTTATPEEIDEVIKNLKYSRRD